MVENRARQVVELAATRAKDPITRSELLSDDGGWAERNARCYLKEYTWPAEFSVDQVNEACATLTLRSIDEAQKGPLWCMAGSASDA